MFDFSIADPYYDYYGANNMKKIILASGGMDPLHSGHIEYLKAAKQLGDILVVGLNSDAWLERKKGRAFMPLSERVAIVRELKCVDQVISFDDSDNTAIDAITMVKQSYPNDRVIFVNGGDRTAVNIPEMIVTDIDFAFGVGGTNKANSSSWILREWKSPKTERNWGYYRVLHEVFGCKVKEITVNPGSKLSMQRHFKRAEHWMITEGRATITFDSRMSRGTIELHEHETFDINVGDWHQLSNQSDKPLRIVEIQYGVDCVEEDIERVEL